MLGIFVKNGHRSAGLVIAVLCITLLSSPVLWISDVSKAYASDPQAGTIRIDGSSTVFPITEAVAEEYRSESPSTRITVGISGTGGGFKKFLAGEIDVVDASRPMSESEIAQAVEKKREFIELPIAYDALTIVVHPLNDWLKSITVADLKKIWSPEAQGTVMNWNQVRPEWPAKPLKLYGAGVDSGTYDYFTEAITGKAHSSRGDFTSSEDDNVLVQGISRDLNALGFMGMAYYQENKGKLKALAVDDGKPENGVEAVAPTGENVVSEKYVPLSRPLFIYVSRSAYERPEVRAFIDFYIRSVRTLSADVGYVPLSEKLYTLVEARLSQRKVGSMYSGATDHVGLSLNQLLSK
jgi:phosphate transport system substrate-binding protein